jgi:tRNA (guanine-N7-)-methyltransferase
VTSQQLLDPVPWNAIFGNDRPVEVEIGPGRGDLLLTAATATPTTNFFAVERGARAAEAIMSAARARGLGNVRVVAGDARCVIARFVPTRSVAVYRVFFPDPWPKTRHRHRRLMTDAFARALARTLVPDGVLHLASDLANVVTDYATPLLQAGLVRVPGATLPAGRPTTAFERKYAPEGPVYACFRRPGTAETDGGSGSRECGRLDTDG